MPGPGKKPLILKLIAGTDRPDRASPASVELPTLFQAPAAPDWLPNAHAIKEWERLAPILVSVGLLTEASISVFGNLCALHGKLVKLWSAGESPTGHMLAQYRALVNDFGLTPVARGRVKLLAETRKENPFDRNGKPPRNRP